MSQLIELPLNFKASPGLQQCYERALDDTKFALYSQVSLSTSELENICKLVKKSFIDNIGLPEEELDDDLYIVSGAEFAGKPLAAVLESHFDHASRDGGYSSQGHGYNGGDYIVEWYPLAFLTVESKDWQQAGLTIVSWDREHGLDAFRLKYQDVGVVLRNLRDEAYAFTDQKDQYALAS